jgi:hypothetical protein
MEVVRENTKSLFNQLRPSLFPDRTVSKSSRSHRQGGVGTNDISLAEEFPLVFKMRQSDASAEPRLKVAV